MKNVDILIIGGGPAGLAAGLSAKRNGVENVLILERDKCLGGILNQCIHNGFGLHTFKEELTGPEYADRYVTMVNTEAVPYMLNTMVCDISVADDGDKIVTAMNKENGMMKIKASAVILAMGCRERPRGALSIPGSRPAGIFSAGTAQYYVNMEGRMPGKKIVILGSGDIGLIMARRLKLEGAEVLCVAEIRPKSGGLKRHIVQCLEDFDIPLYLNTTVTCIHGKSRVEGVTLSQVDENMNHIKGTEKFVECDTLLLSCGLIPENELTTAAGASMDPKTGGPVVDSTLQCSIPGLFACGNVLHVHELVDHVSAEAERAGAFAANYVKGR
ncbi:MAG: FAD-dependent oxidoreductase [Lachnospiraceae bacterium]|nr:FAD-dependent oxidoreductase [Lachnospiraceae bacterium]